MTQDTFSGKELGEAKLVVVGPLNTDFTWNLNELPKPGQTLVSDNLELHFGGKGANQAVAAARFGAQVSILGMIGGDDNGRNYIKHLQEEKVSTDSVQCHDKLPSGVAHIYVDKHGENMIIVSPGATSKMDAALVRKHLPAMLNGVSTVLMPLEIPLVAVLETLRLADEYKVRSVMNASPVYPDFPWGKYPIDTVIVNKHECAEFFGKTPKELASADMAVRKQLLHEKKVNHLVITQGADPTIMLSPDETIFVKTKQVSPVDTVGAGDTFAGVLSAQLATGSQNWSEMINVASMAATLSTLKMGAQTAMPYYDEVMKAVSQNQISSTKDAVK